MDKLLGVKEVMARYGCCRQTAEKILHEAEHMEFPRLMAPEWALVAWEGRKMQEAARGAQPVKAARRASRYDQAEIIRIPRRRA